MFKICDKHNLKKAMTFIVGMGETIDDFDPLKNFITKNNIDKIIFYALNTIKGTMFENNNGPEVDYYVEWIRKTRNEFPNIDIVAGPWVDRVDSLSLMLNAGANALTKFPAIKLFNTIHAKNIEEEIKKAGFELEGSFTKIPDINIEDIDNFDFDQILKEKIKIKLKQYINQMNKNSSENNGI